MRTWVDRLEYLGADAIGRAIGLWFRFCLSLLKNTFRPLTTTAIDPIPSAMRISNPDRVVHIDRSQREHLSPFRKVTEIAISTVLTLAGVRTVPLQSVWVGPGEGG